MAFNWLQQQLKEWRRITIMPGQGSQHNSAHSAGGTVAPEPSTGVGPDGRARDLFILDEDMLDDPTLYLGDDPIEVIEL